MNDYLVVVNLSCSHGNANIAEKDFLALLSFSADDEIEGKYSNQGAWANSRVEFRPVALSDFSTADEPTEAYAAAVQERLLSVAAFLDRQELSAFEKFRAAGMHVYIYIGLYMEDDQMELKLPAAFISSCARLSLGLEIISND